MISYLIGKPIIRKNELTILVNGVGYRVFTSQTVLQKSNSIEELELFIHTHVKEDKLELYGFLIEKDLKIFELVLSVSGVGPKTALLLTEAGSEQLINAVQNAQLKFFTKIPRVGKKLAQKIIIELRGKLGGLKELDLTPLSSQEMEVSEALQNLGFEEEHITLVIKEIDCDKLSLEEIIKLAIQKLANGK
ncbi:MAG: Holliday junction branch migration protein RuvA [Candidatus Woesebacteria bacterium]|jgi:Holliday junction DNA helicase RuvA